MRLTGTRIGVGAYGSIKEVAILGSICAAKRIHKVFLNRLEILEEAIQTRFMKDVHPYKGLVLLGLSKFHLVCGTKHQNFHPLILQTYNVHKSRSFRVAYSQLQCTYHNAFVIRAIEGSIVLGNDVMYFTKSHINWGPGLVLSVAKCLLIWEVNTKGCV